MGFKGCRLFYTRMRHGSPLIDWLETGFDVPAPAIAKRSVLKGYALPDATWVKTGTRMGNTTAFLGRFAANPNITVIKGVGEEVFPNLIPTLNDNVCF